MYSRFVLEDFTENSPRKQVLNFLEVRLSQMALGPISYIFSWNQRDSWLKRSTYTPELTFTNGDKKIYCCKST